MSLQNSETERAIVFPWSNTEYMIQIKREMPAPSKPIKQIAIFERCICLFMLIYLNKLTPRGLLSIINPKMLGDVLE